MQKNLVIGAHSIVMKLLLLGPKLKFASFGNSVPSEGTVDPHISLNTTFDDMGICK
jgi:hypothetical protein